MEQFNLFVYLEFDHVGARIPRNATEPEILISDLYEGGNAESMLARIATLKQSGVKVIVLLALSDDGHPAYHNEYATRIAGMHCPVFGCTPDQFPDLMAIALTGRDIDQWPASNDIAMVRGT